MPNPRSLRTLLSVGFLGVAILLLVIQSIDYINFAVDDVFITLRVVENVIRHNGFVYNIGEHVEGYSNWLWVVILSIPASLGITRDASPYGLLWATKALSYGFGLASLATLWVLVKRIFAAREHRTMLASVAVVFAASCGPIALWMVGGLETMCCTFLFTFAALQAHSLLVRSEEPSPFPTTHAILFGLSLSMAALLRPEPAMHGLLSLGFVWYMLRGAERRRFVMVAVIPFVVVVGSFVAWRLSYYGEFVPNTFFAKTGGGLGSIVLGTKYAFGGLAAIGGATLALVPLAFGGDRVRKPFVLYALMMIAATFLFALYSGGDWMTGFRFFVPVSMLLFILATIGFEAAYRMLIERVLSRTALALVGAVAIAVIACSTTFFDRAYLRGVQPEMGTGFTVRRGYLMDTRDSVVQWLNSHNSGEFSVVSGEAGYIGYFCPRMRLIDVNGLFDKTIARSIKHGEPFNTNYVFDRNPDYVLLFGVSINDTQPGDTSPATANLLALIHDKRFLERYESVKVFPRFEIWARKDVAARVK